MPTNENKIVYNRASRIFNRAVRQHRAQKEENPFNINPRHFFKHVSTRLHPTFNNIVLIETEQTLSNLSDTVNKFWSSLHKFFSIVTLLNT